MFLSWNSVRTKVAQENSRNVAKGVGALDIKSELLCEKPRDEPEEACKASFVLSINFVMAE